MKLILCISCFIYFLKTATGAYENNTANNETEKTCYSEESCLYDYLMKHYNHQVRPVAGPSGTVDVKVSITLMTILSLDEKNEVFQTVLAVSAHWKDKFLGWNGKSSYSGINVIMVSVDNLWLPDFAITNSVDRFYQTTFLKDFRAHIDSHGHVMWLFGGIFKTKCGLNIARYPFDTQMCSIFIKNWAYPEELVNLTEAEFDLKDYKGNSLWEITGHSVKRESYYVKNISYPKLSFNIKLKRKSGYFVLNIILPVIFVVLASLGVFLLPPGCGEKISLGITVLLAFSVFQIVITGSTPVNSDETPLISKGVIGVMGLATLSLLTSMVAVHFHYKGPARRVPKWLRCIAFNYLAKLLCLSKEIPLGSHCHVSSVGPEEDVQVINLEKEIPAYLRLSPKQQTKVGHDIKKNMELAYTQNTLVEMLGEVRKITDTIKEQKSEEFIMEEWKLLARLIDKVLFFFALFILFFGTLLLL